MVGSVGSGTSFGGLAGYLEFGRGADNERPPWDYGASADARRAARVAWVDTLNLAGVDDLATAAAIQAATAADFADGRVTHPVYHLVLALAPEDGDPKDPRTHAMLREIAHDVVQRLGFGNREVLMVGHHDTPHAHVHLAVNRHDRETGLVWDRFQDYKRIERVLREIEVERGLRVVQGKHAESPALRREQGDVDRLVGPAATPDRTPVGATERAAERGAGGAPPARETLAAPAGAGGRRSAELDDPERRPGYVAGRTKGEEREARRTGGLPLVDDVRALGPMLRGARSWDEAAVWLGAAGLRFQAKGQGLVITDGEREVKASRLGRDLSLTGLEGRFGKYAAWAAARPPETPGIERLTGDRPGVDRPGAPRPSADRPAAGRGASGRPAPARGQAHARAARGPLDPATIGAKLVAVARSWDELAAFLDGAGMRGFRRGDAFVVAQGRREVAVPLAEAEARYGERYGAWRARDAADRGVGAGSVRAARDAAREALSPSARYVAVRLGDYDAALRTRGLLVEARERQQTADYGRRGALGVRGAVADGEGKLAAALARVYRDPGAAERLIRAALAAEGPQQTSGRIRQAPEQFGALHGTPDPARSALDRVRDRVSGRAEQEAAAYQAARGAVVDVAHAARVLGVAERRAAGQVGTVFDPARAIPRAERADARVAVLAARYAELGDPAGIARDVGAALARVTPEERGRLAATLRPEAVGMLRAFEAVERAAAAGLPTGALPRSAAERYADREATSAVVAGALARLGPELRLELRRTGEAGVPTARVVDEVRAVWAEQTASRPVVEPRHRARADRELGGDGRGLRNRVRGENER